MGSDEVKIQTLSVSCGAVANDGDVWGFVPS